MFKRILPVRRRPTLALVKHLVVYPATSSVRARRLLRDEKARVIRVAPFTIKLKRKIDNLVGAFFCGIDDGAKHVGVAIINKYTQEGEIFKLDY